MPIPNEELIFDSSTFKKKIISLNSCNWLNDDAINDYLGLIVSHNELDDSLPKVYAFESQFWKRLTDEKDPRFDGYNGVKHLTKNTDIFGQEILFCKLV